MGIRCGPRRGFSLVEILTILVLVGVLLAISLPPLVAMRSGVMLDSAAQQLAGDLRRAQVEAIKRNKAMTLERVSSTTYRIDSVGVRVLEGNVTFGTGSAASVRMASFGPPVTGAATFVLSSNGRTKNVRVNGAGLVSVE